MKRGKSYLVKLDSDTLMGPPKKGHVYILEPEATVPVRIDSSESLDIVYIRAIQDGPDPKTNRDILSYKNKEGLGETRLISMFARLD
jgi:hypothetical protein